MPKRQKLPDTMALPTADNAKWLGIGFLASVLMVFVAMVIIAVVR